VIYTEIEEKRWIGRIEMLEQTEPEPVKPSHHPNVTLHQSPKSCIPTLKFTFYTQNATATQAEKWNTSNQTMGPTVTICTVPVLGFSIPGLHLSCWYSNGTASG
jgi:hypothetical protein